MSLRNLIWKLFQHKIAVLRYYKNGTFVEKNMVILENVDNCGLHKRNSIKFSDLIKLDGLPRFSSLKL